jgi:hypothetical protein
MIPPRSVGLPLAVTVQVRFVNRRRLRRLRYMRHDLDVSRVKKGMVCPLPYDGSFIETFYLAWEVVIAFLDADANVHREVALPRGSSNGGQVPGRSPSFPSSSRHCFRSHSQSFCERRRMPRASCCLAANPMSSRPVPFWPQSFSVPEVGLLIVLVPGFGCGVCLAGGGGRVVVPGVPGCAPAPTAPGCASFRVAGVVCAGQAGAGRAQSGCQQVRNASFHGQSGLIFRTRSRAGRASRAGMCRMR